MQTVTSAVKAPSALLAKSESSLSRGPGAGGGLLGAPTGWLFGGGKQKQQQNLLKSAAFGRLANVDLAAARAPPAKPLNIVVAGFAADEAASELLPHFLDFAPAKRWVLLLWAQVMGIPGHRGALKQGACRPFLPPALSTTPCRWQCGVRGLLKRK